MLLDMFEKKLIVFTQFTANDYIFIKNTIFHEKMNNLKAFYLKKPSPDSSRDKYF